MISSDRVQIRQLPTWRSETHLRDGTHKKEKEKETSHHEKHHHHHHHHEKSVEEPKNEKWTSLLQLQSIVITKPKKEKKRRSTFSFFGSPNRVVPIDTNLMDQHHPIADAVINGQSGGQISVTPIKKKDKKRRYSV